MTAACRACALVDLRACSSPRIHSALQSITDHAQGRFDAAPNTALLLPALQEALLTPPAILIVAGDDQTFSWAAHHIITSTPFERADSLAVAFIGARHSTTRLLCGLPNQGTQQQLAQLEALLNAPQPALDCLYVHTLRLSDNMESYIKYGFFGSFGPSTRALEWAHRLPQFAQKLGKFSFNLAILAKRKLDESETYVQLFLGPEGRAVRVGQGAWVGIGDGTGSFRVGVGGVSGVFGGVLLALSRWIREQVPLWALEERVRVAFDADQAMYAWGGGLCFGAGPRILEISQGDALNILNI